MTVTLRDDAGVELELDDCDAGYLVQQVEVGAPEVRAVTDPRTMTDGVFDRTQFVGQRSISVNLRFVTGQQSRIDLIDALGPFLHPGRRLWLTIALDQTTPRVYRVRPDDWSAPWERPTENAFTVSWRTASESPWALSVVEHDVTLTPYGGEFPGRDYFEADLPIDSEWLAVDPNITTGRVYDRGYPESGATTAPVVNAGNVPADWRATVYGPITGFTLLNVTTGDRLVFPTLNIPAGSNVVIDSASHSVLAEGDPGSSRYSTIDFAASNWFRLAPGVNQMSVLSTVFSAPSQTHLIWRDAFML
jgi:hypothetical protein